MTNTEKLRKIYSLELPDFLIKAAETDAMRRLKDVGMNCGCEYTSFPRFAGIEKYSRFDHSLGVALIVWSFTHDKAQTLAGLFHDVSTPTFAHVIDFLRGDHLVQEATEAGTEDIIAASDDLQGILRKIGLETRDVSDYHRYPVADNNSPRLSADRLEYSLGNMLNYGIRSLDATAGYYNDLTLTENEDGETEIAFTTLSAAAGFAEAALECSKIYVSDEDRYAMQALAELVGSAVKDGVLTDEDLNGTEPALIAKLKADSEYAKRWSGFCAMSEMAVSERQYENGAWRKIFAKKRCIDPLVAGLGRVSQLDAEFGARLHAFMNQTQDYWIKGI